MILGLAEFKPNTLALKLNVAKATNRINAVDSGCLPLSVLQHSDLISFQVSTIRQDR